MDDILLHILQMGKNYLESLAFLWIYSALEYALRYISKQYKDIYQNNQRAKKRRQFLGLFLCQVLNKIIAHKSRAPPVLI
jgi:hypothetical protein